MGVLGISEIAGTWGWSEIHSLFSSFCAVVNLVLMCSGFGSSYRDQNSSKNRKVISQMNRREAETFRVQKHW